MAEAHALGIVHRDLKPANLFCIRRADGRLSIKVLDFGISKMSQFSSSTESAMTQATGTMGSPLYMSPEQMRSAKDVNSQTDLWAIGVILFELLAGKPPFLGDSLPELVLRITTEPPPSLREIRPEIPVGLEAVIRRCLEKDRRRRYSNVAELALALLPFAPTRARGSVERISGIIEAAGLSRSALAVPGSRKNAGVMFAGTSAPVTQTKPGVVGGSSRKGVVVAVVTAGILVIAGAGVAFVRWGIGPHPAALAPATRAPVKPTTPIAIPIPTTTSTPTSTSTPTATPIATPIATAISTTSPIATATSTPIARPAPATPRPPVARPTITPTPAPPPQHPPTVPKSYDHM
jgi:eukaryotic-like serine/threonine-protein kinase